MPSRIDPSGGAGRRAKDSPPPPRAMAESAQRGNRRRAWPRWARPAFRLGLLAVPVLGLGLAGWQAWRDGVFAEVGDAVGETLVSAAAGAGYALSDVLVEGRTETDRAAILGALGVRRGDPIFAINLDHARARLENLPWVDTAAVERRLPDLLYIRLTEREPMAVWQHERRFIVIDRDGRPLADAAEMARRGSRRLESLPHIVGANAPLHIPKLLVALGKVPELKTRVTAAVWVSDRRWDLRLDNGVTVRLPEDGMPLALRQLADSDANARVLDRDIVAIDLRQPDRMVLQTSSTAVLPGREDDKKKPGKKI